MATDLAIALAAQQAGFGDSIATAVAVALAESGGNELAVNTRNTNGSADYGLWQINSVHAADLKAGDWRKPTDNAKMAYAVYSRAGQKWTPWVAYNNGRYKMFETRAKIAAAAVGAATGGFIGEKIIPDVSGVEEVMQFAKFISAPHNWLRVSFILVGGGLLLLVFLAISKQTGTSDMAIKGGKAVADILL